MSGQAAVIRKEIEARLAERIPGALSPIVQQAPRLQPTENARLDALLNGGLPLESVCEATGVDGSGRSSIALSVLASASREGACAYIDVSDALSPRSAAAAGVQLRNLLWIRFADKLQSATSKSAASAPAQEVDTRRERRQLAQQHCGILHPRGETRDLAPALEQMLFYKRNGADARWRARRATPTSHSDCTPPRKARWNGNASTSGGSTRATHCAKRIALPRKPLANVRPFRPAINLRGLGSRSHGRG